MRNRFFCTVLLYGLSCMFVRAAGEGGHAFAEVKDSIKPDADSVSSVVEPVRKTRNPLKWIGRYLSNTNKHEDRPFDFSMLIGPSYSAATSAGIVPILCCPSPMFRYTPMRPCRECWLSGCGEIIFCLIRNIVSIISCRFILSRENFGG